RTVVGRGCRACRSRQRGSSECLTKGRHGACHHQDLVSDQREWWKRAMTCGDAPYYTEDRSDMVRYVPTEVQRLLDVGCATGSFADALCRERIGVEVWGIDPIPLPPGHEDASLRRRIVGHFPEDLPAAERFDCVVFNDVLEHMVDPWGALAAAGDILGGPRVVVASIPNVRNAAAVIQPLVLRGRWDYSDYGILDHTHLRFFTRSTIIEMFE